MKVRVKKNVYKIIATIQQLFLIYTITLKMNDFIFTIGF